MGLLDLFLVFSRLAKPTDNERSSKKKSSRSKSTKKDKTQGLKKNDLHRASTPALPRLAKPKLAPIELDDSSDDSSGIQGQPKEKKILSSSSSKSQARELKKKKYKSYIRTQGSLVINPSSESEDSDDLQKLVNKKRTSPRLVDQKTRVSKSNSSIPKDADIVSISDSSHEGTAVHDSIVVDSESPENSDNEDQSIHKEPETNRTKRNRKRRAGKKRKMMRQLGRLKEEKKQKLNEKAKNEVIDRPAFESQEEFLSNETPKIEPKIPSDHESDDSSEREFKELGIVNRTINITRRSQPDNTERGSEEPKQSQTEHGIHADEMSDPIDDSLSDTSSDSSDDTDELIAELAGIKNQTIEFIPKTDTNSPKSPQKTTSPIVTALEESSSDSDYPEELRKATFKPKVLNSSPVPRHFTEQSTENTISKSQEDKNSNTLFSSQANSVTSSSPLRSSSSSPLRSSSSSSLNSDSLDSSSLLNSSSDINSSSDEDTSSDNLSSESDSDVAELEMALKNKLENKSKDQSQNISDTSHSDNDINDSEIVNNEMDTSDYFDDSLRKAAMESVLKTKSNNIPTYVGRSERKEEDIIKKMLARRSTTRHQLLPMAAKTSNILPETKEEPKNTSDLPNFILQLAKGDHSSKKSKSRK
ncbi:hypothetical protein QCA50_017720 [Cerrena zonata]|uniref:Uncharacterized protein n=1 Tax=Cerrena zonata TaxID=2478898 RepID=A0AAW0FM95_9APHY